MSTGYVPPLNSSAPIHIYIGFPVLVQFTSATAFESVVAGGGITNPLWSGVFVGGAPVFVNTNGTGSPAFWSSIASLTPGSPNTGSLGSVPWGSAPSGNISLILYLEINRISTTATLGSMYTMLGTIHFESSLTTRPTLNFSVFSQPAPNGNLFIPILGQSILMLHDDYGYIFGGSLDQSKATNYPGTNSVRSDLQCVSDDSILTRRLLILTGAFSIGANTDTFTGDGTTRSFSLSQYPAQVVGVKVNGVSVSFGAYSSGAFLWWQIDTLAIETNPSQAAIPSGQTMEVMYNSPGATVQLPIYANQTAGSIVAQLTALLINEGITLSSDAQTGPVVDSIQFTTQDTVDSALTSLVNYISDGTNNYWYYVDPLKVLHFDLQGATHAAPFNIKQSDSSDGNFSMQLTLTTSRDQFANAAWADIANATGGSYAADSWLGDGSSRSFQTTFGIASVDVALGGLSLYSSGAWSSQTVGLTGGSGYDWYYTEGQNTLTQDAGGTTLTTSQALQFLYIPSIAISQQYFDGASIGERKVYESGTGEYDLYVDLSDNNPVLATATVAQNQATYYSNPSQVLEVITYRGGLVSGQSIEVYLPQLGAGGFSGQIFVVDSVEITDPGGLLTWDVTCDNGAVVGDWKKAMVRVANLL